VYNRIVSVKRRRKVKMALKINVKETAISINHCQNDIVDEKGKFSYAKAWAQVKKYNVLANIAKASAASRAAGMMVIYGNIITQPGYPTKETKTFNIPLMKGFWQKGACAPGSWGAANPDAIKPQPTDIIVENPATDVFMGTDLDLILRGNDKYNLILTGVASNWVINSTARHGMELGYNIIIIKDCCQSFNDELHNFAMNVELPNLAQVITLDEYLAALKK
jgi:gluconolactonase